MWPLNQPLRITGSSVVVLDEVMVVVVVVVVLVVLVVVVVVTGISKKINRIIPNKLLCGCSRTITKQFYLTNSYTEKKIMQI